MAAAPDQILTAAQMRAAEEALIAGGETVDSLMQTAGRGAAEWVWRVAARRPVTVLCGPGNNGGDGYVIAEDMRSRGVAVTVLAAAEPRTPAAMNARALYRGPVLSAETGKGTDGVLVDCLFGSGLSRPLAPAHVAMLARLAATHPFRIAVDLPSGVESDSGRLLNPDLPTWHLTLALGAWKFAHWLMPARTLMGTLKLVDIGCGAVARAAQVLQRPRLEAPAWNAHKYRRGLLGIVAGTMPGAALLAGEAAQHGGAGYVKLLAGAVAMEARTQRPDLVIESDPLAAALADPRWSALLVGPGLGRDEAARERLGAVLARRVPSVLDADALMLLTPGDVTAAPSLIATPHEGEMAATEAAFGLTSAGTKPDRARALAHASGMVIVAKGPDTLIAAPDGRLACAPPAPSWLSAAGTGDVLAGTIASRLATGRDAYAAACEGVWLHGEAARLAGPAFRAGELAAAIRHAYAAAL